MNLVAVTHPRRLPAEGDATGAFKPQRARIMYSVDRKDTVIELDDAPQCSTGAPCPVVVATDHDVRLAYRLEEDVPEPDRSMLPREVDEHAADQQVALVRFTRPYAHMFGPPNDEALNGHPLYSRGLRPCGVHEVRKSSWIRGLERMNAVHPFHSRKEFADYRHFIFAFHDTTFECVAEGFDVSIHTGSVEEVMRLAWREGEP